MAVQSINTNIAAYYAQANIGIASASASASVARLSSGNRIVRSSDDVAALSTGTSLRTQVNTLRVALTNAAQGISLLQVADGSLSQVTEILTRQKAIALQAGSGSVADSDRVFLNQEFQALSSEINRLVANTNFNGVNLIDGSLSGSNPLQSDANGASAWAFSGTTNQTGITGVSAADAAGTVGDTTLQGDLGQGVFEVQYIGTAFQVSYTINGSTYVGSDTATATGGSLVLTNGEASITFTVSADLVAAGYTADAAGANALNTAFENYFAAATAFSNRSLAETDATSGATTIEGSAIETDDTDGTLLEGMDGNDVVIRSQYWNGVNAPTISDFRTVGDAGVGMKFSVTINGRTYTTNALIDATDLSASGNITTGGGTGLLRFYLDGDATTNPNEYITIDLQDSVQVIDVDTDESVAAFVSDLNDIFGRSGGGLSFQIGASTTDTLAVSIGNANTNTLFEGASLDVLSQINAATASDALDDALATVTSLRAGVGALQSRFNFASSSIQVSIQNQDAARGELLDTDVASESTSYATAQVKLQAGISVLAQANQILQTLLKLIG
ncbi:MAG: flagellin [Alphaproteobacteria bacterium]